MESFIQGYINSTPTEDVKEEILLERRISPYATLRPGDLAGLLKLYSSLPLPGIGFKRNHDSHTLDLSAIGLPSNKFDDILERNELWISKPSVDDEDRKECPKEDELVDVVCRGEEQNHVPAVYTVTGLKPHELPVIGVYVDKRVCPGFQYRVRRVGSDHFLFDGKARMLESIGMGYGKRLTFKGDRLNNNDCFFWSDSEPRGFAFSIHVVDIGQQFLVFDCDENVVGETIIQAMHEPQEETDMDIQKDKIVKRVSVTMTCTVTYYHRHNIGLVDLMSNENQETVSGEATLTKRRQIRKAELTSISNVFLQRVGHCKLIPEC